MRKRGLSGLAATKYSKAPAVGKIRAMMSTGHGTRMRLCYLSTPAFRTVPLPERAEREESQWSSPFNVPSRSAGSSCSWKNMTEGEDDAGEAAHPTGRRGLWLGGGAVGGFGVGFRPARSGGVHDQGRKPLCGGAGGGYRGNLHSSHRINRRGTESHA